MRDRVHPAYAAALVAAVLAAVAMPVVGHLLDAHESSVRERMTALAGSMRAPHGFAPATGCALRGPGSVRCGRAPGPARAVAEQARQALAAVTGESVGMSCDTYPRTPHPVVPVRVECQVRFEQGEHDVLVTVTSGATTGTRAAATSDYLVQVS